MMAVMNYYTGTPPPQGILRMQGDMLACWADAADAAAGWRVTHSMRAWWRVDVHDPDATSPQRWFIIIERRREDRKEERGKERGQGVRTSWEWMEWGRGGDDRVFP